MHRSPDPAAPMFTNAPDEALELHRCMRTVDKAETLPDQLKPIYFMQLPGKQGV